MIVRLRFLLLADVSPMIPTVRVLLLLASVVSLAACADDEGTASTSVGTAATSTTTTTPALTGTAAVQAAVDEIVADYPTLHGVVVHVVGPGVDETFVAGDNVGAPLGADATFRLASNTKTFTAAAALRLVEQGKVDVDGPITQCLDEQLTAALASDGYQPETITVRQALTHTGGLFDFASGEGSGYVDAVLDESDASVDAAGASAVGGRPRRSARGSRCSLLILRHGVCARQLADRVRERPPDRGRVP